MIKILKTRNKYLSKWVTLVERTFLLDQKIKKWHYIKTFDYLCIFAVTEKNKVAIVNQFRPSVNRKTWEFPGGIKDSKKNIIKIAKNEVEEETGLKVKKIIRIKTGLSDTGRIQNKIHFFFARCYETYLKRVEKGIKVKFVTKKQLEKLIIKGNFDYNLHLSLYMLVKMKKLF